MGFTEGEAPRVVVTTGPLWVVVVVVVRRVVVVVVFEGPLVIVRKPVIVISMGALVMVSRTPLNSGSTMVLYGKKVVYETG